MPVQRPIAGLRVRQHVDDLAEQDRLDELGRGERDASERQHPAEPSLGPEHLKNANVEAYEFHDARIATSRNANVAKWVVAAMTRRPEHMETNFLSYSGRRKNHCGYSQVE